MEQDATDPGWLIDSYQNWVDAQGVPFVEDFAVDLRKLELKPWARFETPGAIVNVKGRGEYLDLWLIEVPPGGSTAPVHHLLETVTYVISGQGSTQVETPNGTISFEWGTGSMFSLPINSTYRFHNASGRESARIAMVTSCPTLMNLFYSEKFIFESDYRFPERRASRDFATDGNFVAPRIAARTQEIWETNFVADLRVFAELRTNEMRGGGGKTIMFSLGDGTMAAHMSEIPVGKYKKGHRHPAGLHIFPVTGQGYSLLWYEGESDYRRVDWEHGICYAPPDSMYHQHFNVGEVPARYLALGFGSRRHPFSRAEYLSWTPEQQVQTKKQIEFENEDPRIAALFEKELGNRASTSAVSRS